jgi:hypothetical protein
MSKHYVHDANKGITFTFGEKRRKITAEQCGKSYYSRRMFREHPLFSGVPSRDIYPWRL